MITRRVILDHTKSYSFTIALTLSTAFSAIGCQFGHQTVSPSDFKPPHHIVRFDSDPTLNDARWDSVTPSRMTLDAQRIADGLQVREPGSFRMAYDARALYLRVDFNDRDVVSTVTYRSDELYLAGDVAEWFIGTGPTADGQPGSYLEMHVAPNERLVAYRIVRPGLIEICELLPFTAVIAIDGTLNNHTDQDQGWSTMITLPRESLEQLDASLTWDDDPLDNLTFLIGRYNYGHHLPYNVDGKAGPELTMYPTQPQTAFHLRPYHARAKLDPSEGQANTITPSGKFTRQH